MELGRWAPTGRAVPPPQAGHAPTMSSASDPGGPGQKNKDGTTRVTVLVALGANLVIALAKLLGGLFADSPALLSEAAHSVADSLNEVFLLASLKRSTPRPGRRAPLRIRQGTVLLVPARRRRHLRDGRLLLLLPGDRGIARRQLGDRAPATWSASPCSSSRCSPRGPRWSGPCFRCATRPGAPRVGMLRRDPRRATTRPCGPCSPRTAPPASASCSPSPAWACTWPPATAPTRPGPRSSSAALLVFVAFRLGKQSREQLIGEAADPVLRREIHEFLDEQPEIDTVSHPAHHAAGHRLHAARRPDRPASAVWTARMSKRSRPHQADMTTAGRTPTRSSWTSPTPRRRTAPVPPGAQGTRPGRHRGQRGMTAAGPARGTSTARGTLSGSSGTPRPGRPPVPAQVPARPCDCSRTARAWWARASRPRTLR